MLAEVLTTLEPAFEHARFERTMFEQAPVLVIPVPLYKVKRRQRGFNQAELIARSRAEGLSGAANVCNLPLESCCAPATRIRRSA